MEGRSVFRVIIVFFNLVWLFGFWYIEGYRDRKVNRDGDFRLYFV